MKRSLYLFIFIISALGCKNNQDAFDSPQNAIASVGGKWLLTETEQSVNGKAVWMPAIILQPEFIVFRYDGVILNADEKAGCCPPKFLNINKSSFEIKPQESITYVSDCSTVLCGACQVWDISISGDEMIIAKCQTPRSKYVRN